LIAPGNKLVGAMAGLGTPANVIVGEHPELAVSLSRPASDNSRQMLLSGTSIAAPAVAGAVAVMLQANPGLTPGLVQGDSPVHRATAGRSVHRSARHRACSTSDGAVRVAKSLRTDIAGLKPGDRLLATGASLPSSPSIVNGDTVNWSGMITAGGSHIAGGVRSSRSTRASTTRTSCGSGA
jgi:subtilisin family serine protease